MHIVGIVKLANFMRTAELDVYEGFDDRLRQLVDLLPLYGSTGRRPGHVVPSPVQGHWPLPGWLAFFR